MAQKADFLCVGSPSHRLRPHGGQGVSHGRTLTKSFKMCIYVYWSLKEKNLYLLTLRLTRALESPSEELSVVLQALVLTLSCTLVHAQGCGRFSGIQELWNVNL